MQDSVYEGGGAYGQFQKKKHALYWTPLSFHGNSIYITQGAIVLIQLTTKKLIGIPAIATGFVFGPLV